MGFGFGPSTNCNNCCGGKCFQCHPCACFTFFDPNTGKDTGDSVNIQFATELINQCPSGNSNTQVGGGYITTVAPYGGELICQSNSINNGLTGCSDFGFLTPLCPGDTQQGCSQFGFTQYCVGNPSGSNAKADFFVTPYPKDTSVPSGDPDTCFAGYCACSMDICNSGSPACMSIPYCPTKLNVSWDISIWQLLVDNGFEDCVPNVNLFVTSPCPYGFNDIAFYSACEVTHRTDCDNDGSRQYWVLPSVTYNQLLGCYVVVNLETSCMPDVPIYVTNFDDTVGIPQWIIPRSAGWDSTLITQDCYYQQLSLCEDNSLQVSFTNHGQGGYIGSCWQQCTVDYCCVEGTIPGKYPEGNLQINFSETVSITLNGGFGPIGPFDCTFAGNVSMPLDKTGDPPGQDCFCTPQANYKNTCAGATVTDFPVIVTGHTCGPGGGDFFNGHGVVTLNSMSAGYVGFQPNPSVGVQIDGTTNIGDNCDSLKITTLAFSAWSCTDLLPANGGIRSRVACFDAGNAFQGWDVGDNCGCGDPCPDGCTYYFSSIDDYTFTPHGWGTVDLCNNLILITLYDSSGIAGQWQVVGTATI